MQAYRLAGGLSLLALTMAFAGCGKAEPSQALDKKEKSALDGAQAKPKREAVAAAKLQNRAGVIYIVNGQEPYQGMAQQFYGNGQMKWEIEIDAGKVVALKRWHENGVLELSCGFTAGSLTDIETAPTALLIKDHERLNGDFAAFFDSGQKNLTANFKHGQANGELTGWRINGNLWIKAKYENGDLVQLENFDEMGQLVGKAGFSGAKFEKAFYLISSILNPPFDKLNGEYILYHPNGQMAVQCRFENGKIVGEERNWTPAGAEIKTMVVTSTGVRMNRVAPGIFTMGSPASEAGRDDNEIQHPATIAKEYWLGRTEITQGEWEAVMGSNPSSFKGRKQLPVEQISWDEAMEFCQKVTHAEQKMGRLPEGYEYTLPTEAQWEYACRAGSSAAYAGDMDVFGWYIGNSGNKSHPVGQKLMNAWGFYDMHGNVWEWCKDWYGDYPNDNVVDPAGTPQGSGRVFRGGSWVNDALTCRSAERDRDSPDARGSMLGFRLCLAPVRLLAEKQGAR